MNKLFKIANKFQKLIKISTHNATKESVEAYAKELEFNSSFIYQIDHDWNKISVALDVYNENKHKSDSITLLQNLLPPEMTIDLASPIPRLTDIHFTRNKKAFLNLTFRRISGIITPAELNKLFSKYKSEKIINDTIGDFLKENIPHINYGFSVEIISRLINNLSIKDIIELYRKSNII